MTLAIATRAMAQSTVVLPLPGRQRLCGHPAAAGLYDPGPADARRGMADRPAGAARPQHDHPAAPRRWLCRHGTIQCGSALLPGAAEVAMSERLQYRVSFVGTQKTVNECKVFAAAYGLEGEA